MAEPNQNAGGNPLENGELENNNVLGNGPNIAANPIGNQANGANVAIIGARDKIRLPEFYEINPEIWFARVEAQFKLAKVVSEQTRYDILVSQVDLKVLTQVWDLVNTTPTAQPYSTLKTAIIDRFSESEQRRLHRLLDKAEVGDRKPSHFLNELRTLARGSGADQRQLVDENMLKTLWIGRLPENVRAILSASDTNDLRKLASLADKIMEVSIPSSNVYATMSSNPASIAATSQLPSQPHPVLSCLPSSSCDCTAAINALTQQFKAFKRGQSYEREPENRRERSKSRGRDRTPANRDRTPANADPDLCWYHQVHGNEAKNCRAGCKFFPKNE